MTDSQFKITTRPLIFPKTFYTTGWNQTFPTLYTLIPTGVQNVELRDLQLKNQRAIERINTGALKKEERKIIDQLKIFKLIRDMKNKHIAKMTKARVEEQANQGAKLTWGQVLEKLQKKEISPSQLRIKNNPLQEDTALQPGDIVRDAYENASDGYKGSGAVYKKLGLGGLTYGIRPLKRYRPKMDLEEEKINEERKHRLLKKLHSEIDKSLQGEELPEEIYEAKYPKRVSVFNI